MTDLDDLVAKLTAAANSESSELTNEERSDIRDMLKAWKLWKSMGFIGRIIVWALLGGAALMTAWDQIKVGLSKWHG